MKKLKEVKFIDILIHTIIGFILLIPILYVITPVLVSIFSHSLNIQMTDINGLWDSSISHINTAFFTPTFTNTLMLQVITDVLDAFNIQNSFIANLINYWILMGALCLLFDIIMQTFIWIIKIITPKEKKAD